MSETIRRSMNHELLEGSVDGKYKRTAPDRTNIEYPNIATIRQRARLNGQTWPFGDEEPMSRLTPDGRIIREV